MSEAPKDPIAPAQSGVLILGDLNRDREHPNWTPLTIGPSPSETPPLQEQPPAPVAQPINPPQVEVVRTPVPPVPVPKAEPVSPPAEHPPEPAPVPAPEPSLNDDPLRSVAPPPANPSEVAPADANKADFRRSLFRDIETLGGHFNDHGEKFTDEQKAQLAIVRFIADEKKDEPPGLIHTYSNDLANVAQRFGVEPTSLKVYGAIQADYDQKDAQATAADDASDLTWSRMLDKKDGAGLPLGNDDFEQWFAAHPAAFKSADRNGVLHSYLSLVSAASEEAAPFVDPARQISDLLRKSVEAPPPTKAEQVADAFGVARPAEIAAITPGSVREAARIFARVPVASRPLVFAMVRAHLLKHGINPKMFSNMLREIPLRVGTDAYSGFSLTGEEIRLHRQISDLKGGMARIGKNSPVDIDHLPLPEDASASPFYDPEFHSLQQLNTTREVTPAEAEKLVPEAQERLETVKAIRQFRAFLEGDFDKVHPTLKGFGGFTQRMVIGGVTIGTYAATAEIPVIGQAAVATAFVGESINGLRTEYPDGDPAQAVVIGTAAAVSQMLLLAGMARVAKGDPRGLNAWVKQIDAAKPLLTQQARRILAEGALKGVKLTGLTAASAAAPTLIKLIADESGMKLPGFSMAKDWERLKNVEPETVGVLATLWLTGMGYSIATTRLAALRYSRLTTQARAWGFSEADTHAFGTAFTPKEMVNAYERGVGHMSPEAQLKMVEGTNKEVLSIKEKVAGLGIVQAKPRAIDGIDLDKLDRLIPGRSLEEWMKTDLEGARDFYLKHMADPKNEGVIVINADRAKYMDAAFRANPREVGDAIHPSAAKLAGEVYQKALATAPPGNVLFLAGAPGVGKSSSGLPMEKISIVLDSTLVNYDRARQQIRNAWQNNRKVSIRYFQKPFDELVIGALERSLNSGGSNPGRPVRLSTIIHGYRQSRITVLKLASRFAREIRFEYFETAKLQPQKVSVEKVRTIKDRSHQELEAEGRQVAEKWLKLYGGRKGVDEDIRRGLLGDESPRPLNPEGDPPKNH